MNIKKIILMMTGCLMALGLHAQTVRTITVAQGQSYTDHLSLKVDSKDMDMMVKFVFDEDAKKSDKVIGVMARFDLVNGFSKTIYWSIEEIEEHAKKYSQAYRSSYDSPWKSNFEQMAKKTVLKALLGKYAPKSVAMQTAIKFDQAKPVINSDDVQELEVDSFDVQYVDNDKTPEATAQVVDPSKDLFGEDKEVKK